MSTPLNASVVPRFQMPLAKPQATAPAAVDAAETRPTEPAAQDDLLAALECADDLLAGLADLGEAPAEMGATAEAEQPCSEQAALVPEPDASVSAATEALAATSVARKAPLVPPMRKQFAAPSTAKPAAPAESAADVTAAPVAKAPRLKSAFARFSDARRIELKAEKPELSFADISKALGAEWSAMSADAKAPFYAAVEAEKAVAPSGPAKPAVKSAASAKPAVSSNKKAAAADGGAEQLKPRAISAYTVFCAERRPALKLEQPELPFGDLSKALAVEWNALCEEDRLPFALRAAERTAAAPPRQAKAAKAAKRAARSSSPELASEPASLDADTDADLDFGFSQGPSAKKRASVVAHDFEWGVDRSKPVAYLVSRLMSGSYVAFRQAGDVLTEETAVVARSSSTASAGADVDDSSEMLLHTEEQEHDLGISLSKFKAALSERSERGAIDLDDLEADSPLCTMLTLEALRSKGGPLDKDVVKSGKNILLDGVCDTVIKIPAVGLSFIVDRLIRGAVQAAVAAERARVAGLPSRDASAPLSKELLSSQPARPAVQMEE